MISGPQGFQLRRVTGVGCEPDVALCRLSYRPAGRTGLEPVTSHFSGDNRFTSARQRTTVKHYRPLAKSIISPGTGSVKILLPPLCVTPIMEA